MIIKYYKDNGTLIKQIQIDAEEEKALSTAMADIAEWHINFINHRARQEINNIVEAALRPGSKMLSDEDKKLLRQLLNEKGIIVASARDLPMEVKKAIIKRITI